MMYVSQIIMLYTLNVYSAVCQLYLNKTGRKKVHLLTTFENWVISNENPDFWLLLQNYGPRIPGLTFRRTIIG